MAVKYETCIPICNRVYDCIYAYKASASSLLLRYGIDEKQTRHNTFQPTGKIQILIKLKRVN